MKFRVVMHRDLSHDDEIDTWYTVQRRRCFIWFTVTHGDVGGSGTNPVHYETATAAEEAAKRFFERRRKLSECGTCTFNPFEII